MITLMKKKRIGGLIILCSILLLLLAGCGKHKKEPITSLKQLEQTGIKIAVALDSPQEVSLAQDYPRAELIPYSDIFLSYKDVASGKIDACVHARKEMELAIQNGTGGVRLLEENYASNIIAVGISPVSDIPNLREKLNAFIAEKKADGTLDDMYNRWVVLEDDAMPEITQAENPSFTLCVGTTGTVMPYSYYRGTELVGYDIELAHRFAAWLGAGLEFKVYDFGGIVPAAQAGNIDCIMSNLFYTPEKDESIPFSDPLFEVEITAMVRDTAQSAQNATTAAYSSMDQLDGKRIGVQTGTTAEEIVKERLPHVEISDYSTFPDMAVALETNKIDGFLGEGLVLTQMAREDPHLKILDEKLRPYDCGFVLQKSEKGKALCAEINAWLGEMRESGELDRLLKKWTERPESERTVPDYKAFPAPKGTLTMTTEGTYPPMNYYREEECVGMEIELSALFCEACGYGLNVTTMDFGSGMLAAVASGKVDFAASGIAITEERKQSVLFSDPYYTGGMMMAVLKGQQVAVEAEEETDSRDGIRDSFYKTFIRENRWQLFVKGIVNTLIITLLSILCGTLLGFLIFMLCRNGNPAANLITRFCLWLIQGMPMVVLLMVLYYVIFGSVAVNGIFVAVIGFTLTFGASVFGLLKMGVGAVDNSQYEAAYALGYSNRRTFFRIILPQALPHVLPAYRGEIVGLIKATAVVGYIAVQDLTKMGDIVRSRTYEAFFPLIAVTVIYFLLEGFLRLAVSRITVNLDPRRRKPGDILKGVKTGDQN